MKKTNIILFMMCLFMTGAFSFTSCTSTPKKVKKDIGLQLYSVRDQINKDLVGTIEKIGKIGYTFGEAAGYKDGKFYGLEPTAMKALMEKNGMKMKGSHTGPGLPKDGEWDNVMEWWDKAIVAHKTVGAEWIVKPSMGPEAYRSLDTLKMYCKYFNAIGEKCNKAGIRFGYHNHSHEFTTKFDGVRVYDILLQNTDPNKVMFEMDLYWITKGGCEPLNYFNKYPGRFELYHVKDVAELGESGEMNFKPFFDNAKKSGMKHYVAEFEKFNHEPFEGLKLSYDFLNDAEYVKN